MGSLDEGRIYFGWTLHDLRRSVATKMAEPPLSIPSAILIAAAGLMPEMMLTKSQDDPRVE